MFKSFKPLLFFVFLPLFFSFVYANILVVEPAEYNLSNQEVIDFGVVAAGDDLKLIFSTNSGTAGAEWDSVLIQTPTTSQSPWVYTFSIENQKRLLATISIPSDARENIYEIKVTALNSSLMLSESFTFRLEVRKKVVSAVVASLDLPSKEYFVGDKKNFKISLTNSSITPQTILVSSTLPREWFGGTIVEVPKKQTIDVTVPVTAKVHGVKDFSFVVKDADTLLELSFFDASITSKPTLSGKLSATTLGFPFFSPSIAYVYFFNAMIGSFLQ